ncbi:TAM domain methyltransferase [Colletotrichum zoysiae]|uniref:TAM domain methyltransferase n=1 Tax=Colletotrichum zoysiae TaxID=1216348 RepID=A0AAD9HLC5_9PEZI|nr:TAM domain methyltransferase [Colletotrichum zoysiae]
MVDSPDARSTSVPAVAGISLTATPAETSSPDSPPTDPSAGLPADQTDPAAQEAVDLAPIEAENEFSIDGSTIDDRISSYTASLASSAVDYPEEYGRRYHAFRPGVYSFPNDEPEMDRLDMAHALMVKSIGNKLYLAPLEKDKVHRILDVGTGTGIWSMEIGDIFQHAEIIGNDLSAIQPPWVPPNVKFEIDDVESPWLHNKKFDYIFVRYMLVAIKDWPKLMNNIYKNLNPGGWVEFQDMNGEYYSDDGTYNEEHIVRQWNKQFVETCEAIGRTACPGPRLEGWVKDAGFQNVTHQRFKVPIGPWAKEYHYRDVGMLNLAQLLDGLEGFTIKLFCGALGQTREEVLVLLAKVRQEMKNCPYHAMFDHHVVYAQKPFAEKAETA